MQQTKKFKMADAISPYLAVSCELRPRPWDMEGQSTSINLKAIPEVKMKQTFLHMTNFWNTWFWFRNNHAYFANYSYLNPISNIPNILVILLYNVVDVLEFFTATRQRQTFSQYVFQITNMVILHTNPMIMPNNNGLLVMMLYTNAFQIFQTDIIPFSKMFISPRLLYHHLVKVWFR